jgi:hypothetical protein
VPLTGRRKNAALQVQACCGSFDDLVTLTFTSWNQIVPFLRQIDQLRAAA